MKTKLMVIMAVLMGVFCGIRTGNACSPPPVAVLTAEPNDTGIGIDVIFDGNSSTVAEGKTIVKYEWDFENDGIYDYNETSSYYPDGIFDGNTTYAYTDANDYTAKLRVTDNRGLTSTDTCTVLVGYPEAILTAEPAETFVDASIIFDGSASSDPDFGGGIIKYEWDFNYNNIAFTCDYYETASHHPDGAFDGNTPHAYTDPNGGAGIYIVKLKVFNANGKTDMATCTVYIYDMVSSTIAVQSDSVIDANYVRVRACNWSGDPNIYKLDSVDNVVIENVIIDNNDFDLVAMLLQGSCSNITFRNCVIKNCNAGIRIGGQGTTVEKLNIEKCIFEKCYYGILFEKPAAHVSISDCTITDCNRPIVFQVAGGSLGDIDNVFLDNIKITGADADCNPINWVGVQHFKINNVSVFGGGVTDDQFALSGCQDGVVSNCHSEGGGNHGFAADYNLALDVSPQRILFIGNTALNDANDGFYLSGIDSNDNKFVGNFSLGNTGSGIVIEKGVKNALLKNACRDNNDYGIYLSENANDTIIMGNILSGNGTNLVYDPNKADVAHNIEN